MTQSKRKKVVEWSKYIGVCIAGITLGSSLIGVKKCSDFQTIEAARAEHDSIVESASKETESLAKRLDEEQSRQRDEHKDFREAIKENSNAIKDNMRLILQELSKQGRRR